MLAVENFFCSWIEILKSKVAYSHLCPLSFEELDSAALKTAVLRRSQPLLEWFLLQKHSCTETCFFSCLLQVKWDLYRCHIHLVQVFLPKCCSDVFLLARNFLFKWICNMLHSCNCFDCCQDYIYLLKISLLFEIWWKIHRSWNSSLFFSLLPHFSWFWTRKDIHLSPILLTLINA